MSLETAALICASVLTAPPSPTSFSISPFATLSRDTSFSTSARTGSRGAPDVLLRGVAVLARFTGEPAGEFAASAFCMCFGISTVGGGRGTKAAAIFFKFAAVLSSHELFPAPHSRAGGPR